MVFHCALSSTTIRCGSLPKAPAASGGEHLEGGAGAGGGCLPGVDFQRETGRALDEPGHGVNEEGGLVAVGGDGVRAGGGRQLLK